MGDAQTTRRTAHEHEVQLTELGRDGNEAVAARFARYVAKPRSAPPPAAGRRVLVSGFGLFKGVSFNISGLVASALASPDLAAADGTVREDDHGAWVRERRLDVHGVDTELCLVTLDVLWDLAAAILVHEMRRWQPELVVMLGRGHGQAIFETGALNAARAMAGFAADGASVETNRPLTPQLTPGDPGASLAMTWNAGAAHAAVSGRIAALGFETVVAAGARPANDYICNNVSYAALCAASPTPLRPLPLAGGRIELQPGSVVSQPRIGFLHLPAGAGGDAASVRQWAEVVLGVIAVA
jgi:hypothetical protein